MRRPPLVSYDTYPHPWVTPAELAAFLGCDERTITRMIASRALPAARLGAHKDSPEGNRVIVWSDTFARQMEADLRAALTPQGQSTDGETR